MFISKNVLTFLAIFAMSSSINAACVKLINKTNSSACIYFYDNFGLPQRQQGVAAGSTSFLATKLKDVSLSITNGDRYIYFDKHIPEEGCLIITTFESHDEYGKYLVIEKTFDTNAEIPASAYYYQSDKW